MKRRAGGRPCAGPRDHGPGGAAGRAGGGAARGAAASRAEGLFRKEDGPA